MKRLSPVKPASTEWLQLKEMDDRLTREKQASLRLEIYRQEHKRAKANGWKPPETA